MSKEKEIQSASALWYNLTLEAALSSLASSPQGLSAEEAGRRLTQYGPNELSEKERISPLAIFLGQFKNFLIIILLAAVVLSAILGETADAIVIGIIVFFAAGLGFVQEFRAEKAMAALKKMSAPFASVLRGGREVEVPAREVVPGDVIMLRAGNRVPADARLLEVFNLRIQEAPLTGESVPVEKFHFPLTGEIGIGDRKNMIFLGTTAVYGRGQALVTATGMGTEFGRIAKMLQEVKEEKTPLQVNLDRVGKWIAIGALALCSILAAIGVSRGHKILEMLIWGVSLAVAAVPEALPAVVTISLTLGVQRMVKRHALIRTLPAVETLGCTTVICSDKTGTLTQDKMTIRRLFMDNKLIEVTGTGYEPKGEFKFEGQALDPARDETLMTFLRIGSLCNDTQLILESEGWKVKGDPTEGSLLVLAEKAGVSPAELQAEYPRREEIPFSSETKRMTTMHVRPSGKVSFSKGAPEVILSACNRILISGKEEPFDQAGKERIHKISQDLAGQALRVLGGAYKNLPADGSGEMEKEMVFVGLAGMIDPPREEAKDALRLCDQAGIKTVMITGDHKLTAVAIARELGLHKNGLAITGAELDGLDDREFASRVEEFEVYARVSPAHKLRVVEALAARGHVVAMTGDGVNDAPALKKADIGIAMGITGTDVSKEAANMVLTDDNFASIVAAVEEGRIIFANIKKFLIYLLSCNLGEILLMAVGILLGSFFGLPAGVVPLIAIQILYVNLATDGLPALALSVDPAEPGVMSKKPRTRDESIFSASVLKYLIAAGTWTGIVSFSVFCWSLKSGRPFAEAQCMCFVTLIFVQFFNAFNCRSLDQSVFKIGFFGNKWMILAMTWEVIMLGLVVYLPILQGPFRTFPLTLTDWGIAVFSSSTIFIGAEIYKLFLKKPEPARA
jgi:Ca2+-transporting ATPase